MTALLKNIGDRAMAITLKDISAKTGINTCSVSHVLNNHPRAMELKAETREKIRRTARDLGYFRNEIAKSMATGRNDVIAFVSCDTGACEYVGRIMSGILEETTRQKFAVKVYHLEHNTPDNIIKQLMEQHVAGIIFHSPKNIDFDLILHEACKKQIPCATVNLNSVAVGINITSDDFQGTREAVKYLAGLGHRRISYISDKSGLEFAVNRENGFIAGMKEYVPDSGNLQIVYGISTPNDENEPLIRNLLSGSRTKRPTAIVCFSDFIACNVLQVGYQMGIKVPGDLSVIGFADLDVAKYATVPLTTVIQPFEQLGKEAANMLIDAIKNKRSDILDKTENRKLEVKLVVRKSTAVLKKCKSSEIKKFTTNRH